MHVCVCVCCDLTTFGAQSCLDNRHLECVAVATKEKRLEAEAQWDVKQHHRNRSKRKKKKKKDEGGEDQGEDRSKREEE